MARNIQRARVLEIAEFRLERVCCQLEWFTKGIRMAAAALARFAKAIDEVGPGLEEEENEPDES